MKDLHVNDGGSAGLFATVRSNYRANIPPCDRTARGAVWVERFQVKRLGEVVDLLRRDRLARWLVLLRGAARFHGQSPPPLLGIVELSAEGTETT